MFAIQRPRPPHPPRGLAQSVFSSPPRLATFRPDLDMVRRVAEAKNALQYATLRRRTCLMVHRACRLFRLARPVAATKVEDSAGRALSAFSVQPSTSERRRH